jgi:hypothetical protein
LRINQCQKTTAASEVNADRQFLQLCRRGLRCAGTASGGMTGFRAQIRLPASICPIDSFCQNLSFTLAGLNDRLWSAAAGRSWDFAVIPARRVRRQVLPRADNLCSPERTGNRPQPGRLLTVSREGAERENRTFSERSCKWKFGRTWRNVRKQLSFFLALSVRPLALRSYRPICLSRNLR